MKHGKLRSPLALLPILPLSLLALSALLLSGAGCHYDDDDDDYDDDDFFLVASSLEVEPNDESASPNVLGVLRAGEALTVEGHARAGDPLMDPTADPYDGFAISLTRPTELQFVLYFDDDDGELDVWIYDPAIDDIALYFEDDFSPESGFFIVDEPVLDFQIVVFAYSGETDYRLEVYAYDTVFSSASPAAASDGWSGGVKEAAGFPQVRRGTPLELRRRALDRYLGRPLADSTLELDLGLGQVGLFHAIDAEGNVFSTPMFGRPGSVPVIDLGQ